MDCADRTGLELDENPMNMVSNRDLPEFHKILRMNIWAYSWIYIIYIRWLVDDCRRSYYPIGDYDHPLTGNPERDQPARRKAIWGIEHCSVPIGSMVLVYMLT